MTTLMKLINLGSRTPQDVPNVRFRPALIDHLLELAAFLLVLANWIYILYSYRTSGGDILSEFYEAGGTALFLFVLLGIGGYLPSRSINFPFRVGRHNVAFQYVLALRLVRVVNIILCTQFLFITLSIRHAWANVGATICLVLLFVAFAGYMVLAWRHR